MSLPIALVIGLLYACGVYMVLRRNLLKIVLGVALLSNAANLLIFLMARPTPDGAALVPPGATEVAVPYTDPLPQALILTAIVITFGVTAFTLVLMRRAYDEAGTDDPDALRTSEEDRDEPTRPDPSGTEVPP